jgi:hypothetical protein
MKTLKDVADNTADLVEIFDEIYAKVQEVTALVSDNLMMWTQQAENCATWAPPVTKATTFGTTTRTTTTAATLPPFVVAVATPRASVATSKATVTLSTTTKVPNNAALNAPAKKSNDEPQIERRLMKE